MQKLSGKIFWVLLIIATTTITILFATYEPCLMDDSEMFRKMDIRHLEDSLVRETGKGSLDTMTLDTTKMFKIFSDIFSEKN